MNFSDKIVTSLPLETIWTEQGNIEATRISYLTSNDIKQLLQKEPVQFIVANIGHQLQWIHPRQCFAFWKNELERHIADNIDKVNLDTFGDNYAYVASQWISDTAIPIILLEKAH